MNRYEKMLLAVKHHILPLTTQEVERGNHIFGGAVLYKDSLETVVAGSNNRLGSPLFHGEIDTMNRFFAMPQRPAVDSLLFLATHDPCPMCAAAIAWAGFDELWTLFDYDDVEGDCNMPVDLIMFRELFGCEGTRHVNPFYKKFSLKRAIMNDPEKESILPLYTEIVEGYAKLVVQDFDYPCMPG